MYNFGHIARRSENYAGNILKYFATAKALAARYALSTFRLVSCSYPSLKVRVVAILSSKSFKLNLSKKLFELSQTWVQSDSSFGLSTVLTTVSFLMERCCPVPRKSWFHFPTPLDNANATLWHSDKSHMPFGPQFSGAFSIHFKSDFRWANLFFCTLQSCLNHFSLNPTFGRNPHLRLSWHIDLWSTYSKICSKRVASKFSAA